MALPERDQKRVLGIVGSPRRGGNTEILVDQALIGAQEAGAQITKLILNELEINPCQGCNACLDSGRCEQQDHVPALLQHMRDNQVWVLGTPVYWRGPTAQFKAFLDRWHSVKPAAFAGRRAILIVPLSNPDEGQARCTVEMIECALAHFKVEVFATLVVPDVWEAGKVRRYPEALAHAHRAGREAVTDASAQAQANGAEDAVSPVAPEPTHEATIYVTDPSQMEVPRLVITGAPILLPNKEEILIGRAKPQVTPVPDVDLVPHGGDQSGVSRQHARMRHLADGWVIEDLESTNGTFVNGVRVSPGEQVRVRTGDIIRLSMLTFIFYE